MQVLHNASVHLLQVHCSLNAFVMELLFSINDRKAIQILNQGTYEHTSEYLLKWSKEPISLCRQEVMLSFVLNCNGSVMQRNFTNLERVVNNTKVRLKELNFLENFLKLFRS